MARYANKPKNNFRKPIKKNGFWSKQVRSVILKLSLLALLIIIGYNYRLVVLYYLGFKSKFATENELKLAHFRNTTILQRHKNLVFGMDVSEYQGDISWADVGEIEKKFSLQFVFIRATVGKDRLDKKFTVNWRGAKNNQVIRGAYHYYRPNENSLEQAQLFIKTVQLTTGDLPPVLDIEQMPKEQSIGNLKKGLQKWLNAIENHYHCTPIIYTSEKYYDDFLKNDFSDYPIWIANYNDYRTTLKSSWQFWQFTEKAIVSGMDGFVDINIFNGNIQNLDILRLP